MIRSIGALLAGALAWKAVATLATLLGRVIWPAYAAVEVQRVFTLDMLMIRLAVGAVATLAFGAVAAWVARGEQKAISLIIAAWLAYSVIDHVTVWSDFPVWYHLAYLAYVVPLAWLGSRLTTRRSVTSPALGEALPLIR